MWNNKKKDTPQKNTIIPSAGTPSLNSIVQGTNLEGTISAESDIRIDGTIKGSLTCKAKVIIGPTGYVDGEIQCANSLIEGRFVGTLQVSNLLHIKETADVNGDISTGKLIVEPGAVFNVSCNMSNKSGNGSVASTKEAKNIVKKAAKVNG